MSAIAVIARKELSELVRDARLHWCAAIFAVLMASAFLLGWQHMQRIDAERQAAQNITYEQWLGQGEKNPHSASHFGQYAFKPSSPLLWMDPGVTPYVGVTVWMEAHKQNEFRFRPARDATTLQRFGDLSAAFVLQVLAPLMIILLTFNAFSNERERGTLRQLLSVGVRPAQLLAGKAVAIAVVLCALLLPLGLAGVLSLPFYIDHDHDLPSIAGRAALLAAGYAIYLIGFAALALGVSAAVRSSRKALIVLLAFWMLNSFVVPRMMTDLARLASPTPTAVEFQDSMVQARKESTAHDASHPAYIALLARTLKKHQVASIEALPFDFDGLALRQDDEFGYRIFDRHYQALWRQFEAQERIRAWTGLLFPLAAMQPLSMGLAGTDTSHHNDFAYAAERYRRGIQTITGNDLIKNRKYGDKNYVAGAALWKQVMPFDYDIPEVTFAIGQQWLNGAITCLWALAAIFGAVLAVRRLRPV